DVPRRSRLWLQVGSRLDARHPPLSRSRPPVPKVPPQLPLLPHALCLRGELRPPALPRRSRPRPRFPHPENAWRPLAKVRQSPLAFWLHVHATWQETPLHGGGVRPMARMEPRWPTRLGIARTTPPRRSPTLGPRPEYRLPPGI